MDAGIGVKSHPEYSEMKRQAGGGYDPERFDLKNVNKLLPKFKDYMRIWKGIGTQHIYSTIFLSSH